MDQKSPVKPKQKSKQQFLFGLVSFAIVLAVCLFYSKDIAGWLGWLWSVFLPLILGFCIAFILNIPVVWFEKKLYTEARFPGKKGRWRRPLSVLTTLLALLLLIFLVISIVVPQIAQSVVMLTHSIPENIESLKIWLNSLSEKYPQLQATLTSLGGSSEAAGTNLVDYLKNGLGATLQTTYTYTVNALGQMLMFFIGLMFSFYVLSYKEKLGRQVRELLYSYLSKKAAGRTLYIAHLTYNSFAAFVYGQCLEALVLFAMYVVVALVFQLPYSMMIAVMIGVLSLIPLFGAWIGWAIGSLLILTVNPMQVITFTIIFFVISQIEGNFIYPHIVGNSMGLPGIWVLAAVTVGGNMMGIVGMIISVPIASVLYTLLKFAKNNRLKKRAIPEQLYLEAPDWEHYDPEKELF